MFFSSKLHDSKAKIALASALVIFSGLFVAVEPSHSTPTPSIYAVLAAEDTTVLSNFTLADQSTDPSLILKSGAIKRIPYVKFIYDEAEFTGSTVAELAFFVTSQNDGTGPAVQDGRFNGSGDVNTRDNTVAFYVDVYGIKDGGLNAPLSAVNWTTTNDSDALFPKHRNGLSHIPSGASELGTISVPVSASNVPLTRVTLSTAALNDFLVEDGDNSVYIFLVRRDTAEPPSPNLVFASSENTTCYGPQLRNHIGDADNTRYPITYQANGLNVSGLPTNAESNHFTCNSISVAAAPPTRTGFLFDSWNTQADASGDSYSPGTQLRKPQAQTLHAIWNADPNYVEPEPEPEPETSPEPENETPPEGQTASIPTTSSNIAGSPSKVFTVQGFKRGKALLSSQMKAFMKQELDATPNSSRAVCIGTVRGKEWSAKRDALALARAKAGCDYIKELRPSLAVELKKRLIPKRSQNPLTVRIRVF